MPNEEEEEDEESSTVTASRLPTSCCVALQSQRASGNPYYLSYDAGTKKSLRLNGEGVTSPRSRFHIEPSRGHNRLVHIRCCYDNKYWVAAQHGSRLIVGTADEAEEDLSKPTCTLFRIIRVPPDSVRLLHVHLEKYAGLPLGSDDNDTTSSSRLSLLTTGEVEDHHEAIASFTAHDLTDQFVLPRYLAFKGDNGMYLRPRRPYLQFSGRHVGDEASLHTVDTNRDGTIRLMSCHAGHFWWRDPNWISIDSTDDVGVDALFRAIRLPEPESGAGGFFALQSMGNDYFCRRLTLDGKWNCLNAATPTITAQARFKLEEPVVSREVCNVVFDLSEPRVYGRSRVTIATASALNGTSSSTTAKVKLEYTGTAKMAWASTVTLKLDAVPTKISARVPVIAQDGRVEVSAQEFCGSYCWGSAVVNEEMTAQKVIYDYGVTVPPMTKVTVALTATRASCDVPFAYSQRDTLFDEREITYDMDDGLYTGINYCYDFRYETSEENL
ncbi:unnamed protein product [Urochloa humidicola]